MLIYFRDLADNKIFFQHPDLMRALAIHNTVLQMMVNTLNRQQQETAANEVAGEQKRRSSLVPADVMDMPPDTGKVCLTLFSIIMRYT